MKIPKFFAYVNKDGKDVAWFKLQNLNGKDGIEIISIKDFDITNHKEYWLQLHEYVLYRKEELVKREWKVRALDTAEQFLCEMILLGEKEKV